MIVSHPTSVGQDYVIRDDGGGQIKHAVDSACVRSGVRRFTPHVFRHTWATWYYGSTQDIIRLMALGGWKKMEMVQRYVKLAPRNIPTLLRENGWQFDVIEPEERKENVR